VLPSGYSPELDVSELCNDTDANYYQQLISVLRWATELGRFDICCEVSVMAAFSAAPRVGHLQSVFHNFAYLKQHGHSKIVFDDSHVDMPVPNLHRNRAVRRYKHSPFVTLTMRVTRLPGGLGLVSYSLSTVHL